MLTPNPLRTALADFLGADRFTKFVRAGIGARMFYWQERELERFREANPDFKFNLSDLVDALRICEIHQMDLLPCKVEVFRCCLNWSNNYLNEKKSKFPNAAIDMIMVSDDFQESHLDSWYCPKCREIADKWRRI